MHLLQVRDRMDEASTAHTRTHTHTHTFTQTTLHTHTHTHTHTLTHTTGWRKDTGDEERGCGQGGPQLLGFLFCNVNITKLYKKQLKSKKERADKGALNPTPSKYQVFSKKKRSAYDDK
jgi:hypothetical protein